MPYVNGNWVEAGSITLESINKKLDQLIAKASEPPAETPATPSGRRATNASDACLNAYMGLDYGGYPHRWSGPHAGSLEDFYQHLEDNNLEAPVLNFGPAQLGRPTYADWKDPLMALCLLASNDLKTPREIQLLGFYATAYQEGIKNNGWKTTTVEEWFEKILATTGHGGASGGDA